MLSETDESESSNALPSNLIGIVWPPSVIVVSTGPPVVLTRSATSAFAATMPAPRSALPVA